MPVVFMNIPEPHLSPDAETRLLTQASQVMADCLNSPIERVRIYIKSYCETRYATAGQVGKPSPFFEFLIFQGRPAEMKHAIMAQMTDLIARETGLDASDVRGVCRTVSPDDWCIGGEPASKVRATHIAALSEQVF